MPEPADPMNRFAALFASAAVSAPPPPADHTAGSLATVDADGRPAARIVLLRQFDANGFVFFTNYESRKARELDATGRAALCFYWHWLEEQVRVEGQVVRVTAEESDAYFATRPRGSQVGAWASRQSAALTSRQELEDAYRAAEARFAETVVPRPPFWGGYRLVPERMEFWKASTYRLHERQLFERTADGSWGSRLLFP
jgi:pyridoxamine 5'-phosphate oxidase